MPGSPFSVEVDRSDGAAILRLHGDVNRAAQQGLEAAYEEAGAIPVILDFTSVDYINSTGIAVIVSLLARARSVGRPVKAYGLSDHYRQIFQITRISDFMDIHDDESAALAAD